MKFVIMCNNNKNNNSKVSVADEKHSTSVRFFFFKSALHSLRRTPTDDMASCTDNHPRLHMYRVKPYFRPIEEIMPNLTMYKVRKYESGTTHIKVSYRVILFC